MLSPRLTNCIECNSISSLLAAIDCKLTEMAKNLYNNTIFSLNKSIERDKISDLLNYKRILSYKLCNENYAACYSLEWIASRVRVLVGRGCTDIPIIRSVPTTTTTTTPAPTTTTTTSSTTTVFPPTTTTTTTACPCALYGLSGNFPSVSFTFIPCGEVEPITIFLGDRIVEQRCIDEAYGVTMVGDGLYSKINDCCTVIN